MTDEPDKAVKTVTAVLLAALPAGCKTEPPKTGYLYVSDDAV